MIIQMKIIIKLKKKMLNEKSKTDKNSSTNLTSTNYNDTGNTNTQIILFSKFYFK